MSEQWFLNESDFAPQENLAKSGNMFRHHNQEEASYNCYLVGTFVGC